MTRTKTAKPFTVLVLGLGIVASSLSARTVEVRVGLDPTRLAGTDPEGRPLVYTPNPIEPGSSISHWDRSAFPDLLMEPSASDNLAFRQVDLTVPLFQDIGWPSGGSTVTLHFTDAQGTGFFDSSLGATRRAAAEAAAAIWRSRLGSSMEIHIEMGFSSLPCGDDGATLAQAGAQFIYESFPGALVGGTWYHGALAESLSGQNLSLEDDPDPSAGEVVATFNEDIDSGCLGGGSRFYYGTDANIPAGQIGFINVALHEMAHGLGFASFVDESTGQQFLGLPDIYSRFLFDRTQGRTWANMTNAQRVQSARNTGNVSWNGNKVRTQAPSFLDGAPSVRVESPSSIAGSLEVGTAEFGPSLTDAGVTGELVRALDGSTNPLEACSPITNAGEINGHIALIDRGTCNFTVKVAHAQAAGARAAIIVNNVDGPPIAMGGSDPSITIPSVSIRQDDGAALDAALAAEATPGQIRLGQADISVDESAGQAQFAIVREQGSDDRVSVTWTVSANTASSQDLALGSGLVSFGDGASGTRTVDIGIVDDDLAEDLETAIITLSSVTGGATLGSPSTGTISIVDDDLPTAGAISFTDPSPRVGEGIGTTSIFLQRLGGTIGDVGATLNVAGGTATNGVDYSLPTGPVMFADGQTTVEIPVTIIDDEESEGGETIVLTISDATGSATIGAPSTAILTITDDEPCEMSDTVHCLQGDRFQVEVQWTDFDLNSGVGHTATLFSADSGLFWFFDENNWELLVKVIDACAFNDRYWVFSAATTNVEYTLRVTDRMTGEVREYLNPLGQQAAALTDTDAFATCP